MGSRPCPDKPKFVHGTFMANLHQGIDLPEMWIPGTYEALLRQPPAALRLFPLWLFLGPRPVGKSSLLQRCAEPHRQLWNLDDLAVRGRAIRDPGLFGGDVSG